LGTQTHSFCCCWTSSLELLQSVPFAYLGASDLPRRCYLIR
jgi:hypothetical protein